MRRPCRNHTAAFKAKVAVAALRGDKTLIQLAQQFDVHANQITQWKTQWLDRAKDSFETAAERSEKAGPSVKDMQAKIWQWHWRTIPDQVEDKFFSTRAWSHWRYERQTMIDHNDALPVVRQCEILSLSRSSVYSRRRPVSPEDLALMRRIDELHLELPFAGARMLHDLLRLEGFRVGRQQIARLMRLMGIEALYRKPSTSRRHPAHPVFPYLLRELPITRPNPVWAMDITYSTPSQRGPPTRG